SSLAVIPRISALALHDALPIYLCDISAHFLITGAEIEKRPRTFLSAEKTVLYLPSRRIVYSGCQYFRLCFIAALYQLEKALLGLDRKSTRLNSSHVKTSYAVFC